jgi:hypothetical protein
MTTTTTTPAVENIKIREQGVDLRAEMKLAGVKVAVTGTYFINSNAYYPSTVTELDETGYPLAAVDAGLEEYCETMGWNYYDTMTVIQEAVEER